eukprot:TRINITY_DN273_c0_g4_i1.p1 TRINITY_DN273_c0_g4~~TRINITY_DN273_c0_g4_i1.p1  ORF type:complete len:531 (+),score=192.51 TRINITY_DN273_c0_g4_i1:151-1743(+)
MSSEYVMRCHYEVLGIDHDATNSQIKKAFYKMSRIWHPDKNIDKPEEATIKFKEIQAAHAVLMDSHEREWYDNHREAILRGKNATDGDASGYSVNLWEFFSPACYDGFESSPRSFYTVFGKVFKDIDDEDRYGKSGTRAAPLFGDTNTPYSQISSFYGYWIGYVPKKGFEWADEYNLAEGETRRIRRAMEAENKKKRTTERKEWMDKVRELASYVKHRDPRVMEQKMKIEKERAEAAALERQRVADLNAERRRKAIERQAELAAMYTDDSGSDVEIEETIVYSCGPCRKTFKTEKQLEQHFRSKKHIQALKKLGVKANRGGQTDSGLGNGGNSKNRRNKNKKNKRTNNDDDGLNVMLDGMDIGEDELFEAMLMADLSKETPIAVDEGDDHKESDDDNDDDNDDDDKTLNDNDEKTVEEVEGEKEQQQHEEEEPVEEDRHNDEGDDILNLLSQLEGQSKRGKRIGKAPSETTNTNNKKKGKKKKRRRGNKEESEFGSISAELKCRTCGEAVGSRNALFKHLESSPMCKIAK